MRSILQMLAVAAALAICNAPPTTSAQNAAVTIRFIYPNAAGSSGDALTRLIAERMRSETGQAAIVENRAGGAGRLGLYAVKGAQPDGTTLLLTQMAPMTLFPHVHRTLDYDPVKDFTPIGQVATFEFGIAVNRDIPVKTPQELLQWLKANPDKAMFGVPGNGGLPHFFGLLVGQAAGVDMVPVSYKGTAKIIADLLGGQLPMMVALASDLAPLHKDGKLRVIATSDSGRFAGLPDVPTFKESGIDIEGRGWFAIYGPAKMPTEAAARLSRTVATILQSPAVRTRITALGLKPTGTSAAELAAIQNADSGKWGPVIKASGFTLD